MRRRRSSGNMVLEGVLWIPVMVLLVVGTVQLGKISYTYFSLRKAVFSAARYLAVQQGTDVCNLAADANAQAAINFAINDPNTQLPLISGLTPAMLAISTQCVDPTTNTVGSCLCGGADGEQRPDYITVNVNGFSIQPRIPGLTLNPITLRPSVTVAFGGSTL